MVLIAKLILSVTFPISIGVIFVLGVFYYSLFTTIANWVASQTDLMALNQRQRLHNIVFANKIIAECNFQRIQQDLVNFIQFYRKFEKGIVETEPNAHYISCSYRYFVFDNCTSDFYQEYAKSNIFGEAYFHRTTFDYNDFSLEKKQRFKKLFDYFFLGKVTYYVRKTDLFNLELIYNAYDDSLFASIPVVKSNLTAFQPHYTCIPGEFIENYDPRCRPWYLETVALGPSQQVHIVKPYKDAFTHQITMSATSAVYDENDNLIIVTGLDFQISNLIEQILKPQDTEDGSSSESKGYSVFFHKENNTVFHHKYWKNTDYLEKNWVDLEFNDTAIYDPKEKDYFRQAVESSKEYSLSQKFNIYLKLGIEPFYQEWQRGGQEFVSLFYPIELKQFWEYLQEPKQIDQVMMIGRVEHDTRNLFQVYSVQDDIAFQYVVISEKIIIFFFILISSLHYAAVLTHQVEIPIETLTQFLKLNLLNKAVNSSQSSSKAQVLHHNQQLQLKLQQEHQQQQMQVQQMQLHQYYQQQQQYLNGGLNTYNGPTLISNPSYHYIKYTQKASEAPPMFAKQFHQQQSIQLQQHRASLSMQYAKQLAQLQTQQQQRSRSPSNSKRSPMLPQSRMRCVTTENPLLNTNNNNNNNINSRNSLELNRSIGMQFQQQQQQQQQQQYQPIYLQSNNSKMRNKSESSAFKLNNNGTAPTNIQAIVSPPANQNFLSFGFSRVSNDRLISPRNSQTQQTHLQLTPKMAPILQTTNSNPNTLFSPSNISNNNINNGTQNTQQNLQNNTQTDQLQFTTRSYRPTFDFATSDQETQQYQMHSLMNQSALLQSQQLISIALPEQQSQNQNIYNFNPMFLEIRIISETFFLLQSVINYKSQCINADASIADSLLHFACAYQTFKLLKNTNGAILSLASLAEFQVTQIFTQSLIIEPERTLRAIDIVCNTYETALSLILTQLDFTSLEDLHNALSHSKKLTLSTSAETIQLLSYLRQILLSQGRFLRSSAFKLLPVSFSFARRGPLTFFSEPTAHSKNAHQFLERALHLLTLAELLAVPEEELKIVKAANKNNNNGNNPNGGGITSRRQTQNKVALNRSSNLTASTANAQKKKQKFNETLLSLDIIEIRIYLRQCHQAIALNLLLESLDKGSVLDQFAKSVKSVALIAGNASPQIDTSQLFSSERITIGSPFNTISYNNKNNNTNNNNNNNNNKTPNVKNMINSSDDQLFFDFQNSSNSEFHQAVVSRVTFIKGLLSLSESNLIDAAWTFNYVLEKYKFVEERIKEQCIQLIQAIIQEKIQEHSAKSSSPHPPAKPTPSQLQKYTVASAFSTQPLQKSLVSASKTDSVQPKTPQDVVIVIEANSIGILSYEETLSRGIEELFTKTFLPSDRVAFIVFDDNHLRIPLHLTRIDRGGTRNVVMHTVIRCLYELSFDPMNQYRGEILDLNNPNDRNRDENGEKQPTISFDDSNQSIMMHSEIQQQKMQQLQQQQQQQLNSQPSQQFQPQFTLDFVFNAAVNVIEDAKVFAPETDCGERNQVDKCVESIWSRSGVILHLTVNPLSNEETAGDSFENTSRRVEAESLPISFMRCSLVPQLEDGLMFDRRDYFNEEDYTQSQKTAGIHGSSQATKKESKQSEMQMKKFSNMKNLIDHFANLKSIRLANTAQLLPV